MKKKQMKRWMEGNLNVQLDTLDREYAEKLLALAEHETWEFLDLGTYAFKMRRKVMGLPAPESSKEVTAFLLELRIKLQMLHEGFPVPAIPLFEIGGDRLYRSRGFQEFRMLHSSTGGLV